jgi:CBS domain-containing protein
MVLVAIAVVDANATPCNRPWSPRRSFAVITARDIMTEDLVTIRPSAPLREAVEQLLAREISGLPVVDDSDRLVGIITEFALMAVAYDKKVLNEPVSQHMTTELLTVDVKDSVRKVADLCVVHRVRRVPVMENGRLVGLVARRDVLKAMFPTGVACST